MGSSSCASYYQLTSFSCLGNVKAKMPNKNVKRYNWRKRSIPTHSGWLYPLTFDAGKGLKEA